MHCKIIATLSTLHNENDIHVLRESGMDIARLNGAHGTLDWHCKKLEKLQKMGIPVLLDLPGHKLRLILSANRTLNEGEIFTLQENDINFPDLYKMVVKGQHIFIKDGSIKIVVVGIQEKNIYCIVEQGGEIQDGDGVNIIGIDFGVDFTERDQNLLNKLFNMGIRPDIIGVSFCESKEQIDNVKAYAPKIAAKIETQKGIDHLDEILESADFLIIARGDLAIETSLEKICVVQKQIIRKAGKTPVIIATGLLESMCLHPYPERSEVADVTNAVLDGAYGLLLSNETAACAYGEQSVKVLKQIIGEAEKYRQSI